MKTYINKNGVEFYLEGDFWKSKTEQLTIPNYNIEEIDSEGLQT